MYVVCLHPYTWYLLVLILKPFCIFNYCIFSTILHQSQFTLEVPYCSENFFPLGDTDEGQHLFFQLKHDLHFICIHVISSITLITPSISSLSVRHQNWPRHQQHSIPTTGMTSSTWLLALNEVKALETKDWRDDRFSSFYWRSLYFNQRCLLARRLSADIFTFSCLSSTQSL